MKPVDSLSDDEFAHLVQRAVALPDAPPAWVRAAVDLWSARESAPFKEVAQAARRLVSAVLGFDSWSRPPMALGMRSAASDTRHLLFSANGRDIDLRISRAVHLFALTGQVLGPDETGWVELSMPSHVASGEFDAHVASLDALGEFRFDGVSTGTYRMILRIGGDEIVLPPIEVGERAS